MKLLILFLFIGWPLSLISADKQSLFPTGEITAETPTLDQAYPGDAFIRRTPRPTGDLIDYEVRFYAADGANTQFHPLSFGDVALVACDEKGGPLVSSSILVTGYSTQPPNKNQFWHFRFAIHKSLENFTVINIGRHNGIRTVYTRYKLPMKEIDHPKAH